ncbi:MAG: histidine kinase [Clostridia bacterium]|nr:histidine kinase [Clostridia bacterium]
MTAKIFRYIFLMGGLVLLLCAGLFFGLQYAQAREDTYAALREEASFAVAGVQQTGEDYLRSLNGETAVTWIASDGSVLFDSTSQAGLPSQSDCPEVADAFAEGEGQAIRADSANGAKTVFCAVLCPDGTVLRLSRPLSPIWSVFLEISPVFWVIVLVLLLAGLFAFRAARQITKPINSISLDTVEATEVYPELSPLITRIREQNLTINDQIDELKRKQKEILVLTDNMSEGFVLTDANGIVLSANTISTQIIPGCEAGADLTAPEHGDISEIVRTALGGERVDIQNENGERCHQIIATPVTSKGKISGAVILIVDVTETVQRERLRREFSANVSHELKTPLTSISGFAELIMQDLVPPDKAREFAGDIYRESHRLISLINDIIKLSKLDEQTILTDKETLDLYDLAGETLSSLQSVAESKQVSLRLLGDHAQIEGVEQFISEMFYNLCDNAIKYNKAGGSVTVEVRNEPDAAVVTVSDTGVGIPYEYQNRVFERFYRVDNARSKEIPGTGLGLSIVKHAALLHGAHISLNSVPDRGTEITVRFPAKQEL